MKFLRWMEAKFSPRHNDVYQLISEAHVHLQSQNYDKARALLLQAIGSRDRIKDSGAISWILSALEATWLFTERYEEQIAYFSQYVNRYPEDSAGYRGRAAALWYEGQLQDAVRDFSCALELNPSDILLLSGRGQVLAELGENRRAMEDLNLALQTLKTVPKPDFTWVKWYEQVEAYVRNGRGVALAGLGEEAPAKKEFELSISLCPENAWVYHNRAQVHDRAGDRKEASEDYQKALTMKNPALNPIRKKHAQARFRELTLSL